MELGVVVVYFLFCQEGILSGRNFVRQEFCQEGILSGRDFARKGFCQEGILSARNFVRQEFCQAGILSGRDFVRKRALPGSGLCQGGESASGGAKGEGAVFFCGEWRRVSFGVVCDVFAGEASQLPGGEGGMGARQLWSWVLLLSTFFFLGAGASQLWSWVLLLSTFFFWGAGGESASGLCVLSSAGDGGESASGGRRGDGGASALELGVVVVYFLFFGGGGESALELGVVVVYFLFLGGGGESASGLGVLSSAGNGGESASGLCDVVFCGGWRQVMEASQLWSCV